MSNTQVPGVSETGLQVIDKFTPAGVETQYALPTTAPATAVAFAGNLFYGSGGSIYEILAGTATPMMYTDGLLNADDALQVDSSGNLFLSDSSNLTFYL